MCLQGSFVFFPDLSSGQDESMEGLARVRKAGGSLALRMWLGRNLCHVRWQMRPVEKPKPPPPEEKPEPEETRIGWLPEGDPSWESLNWFGSNIKHLWELQCLHAFVRSVFGVPELFEPFQMTSLNERSSPFTFVGLWRSVKTKDGTNCSLCSKSTT